MDGRADAGPALLDLADVADLNTVRAALAEAFRQSRDRIDAVAYMERHELLDAVERVGRALDEHLREATSAGRVETIDQVALLTEAYGAIGLDLPRDVLDHVGAAQVRAWDLVMPAPGAGDRIDRVRRSGHRPILVVPAGAGGAVGSLRRRFTAFDDVVVARGDDVR
jgi:hypothetical protein